MFPPCRCVYSLKEAIPSVHLPNGEPYFPLITRESLFIQDPDIVGVQDNTSLIWTESSLLHHVLVIRQHGLGSHVFIMVVSLPRGYTGSYTFLAMQ